MVGIEWTVLISAVCTVIGACMGIMGYHRNAHRETAKRAKQDASVLTEIKYIKEGVDDIRREQREQACRFSDVSQRLSRVEESTRLAHQMIENNIGGRLM
ncbi:MAG: hypothetical protein ACOX88_09430 [Christensenellales bacterium]|jgi:hypothetical protein